MAQTIDELGAADERTLRFTPHGLGVGVQMTPESSARYLQAVTAQFTLASNVAESTRLSVDRLKTVFVQGLFCYDLFTLVHDHALLVIEQALRDRFVDYHQGTVRFVDTTGTEHPITAQRYDDVTAVVKRHKKKWQLVIGDGRDPIDFNGTLAGLYSWARTVGLLRGQHNRRVERALVKLRNYVAHPTSYHLVDPWQAARQLSDLTEIINQLWGNRTPGGRLYPAPIRREVVVLAWSIDGSTSAAARAADLATAVEPEDKEWRYAIVRAVFHPENYTADPGLDYFDTAYEATSLPADPLWGPGTLAQAREWWEANHTLADECDYLDRTFAVRRDRDQLYRPVRAENASVLAASERAGIWYVVRADFPEDAYQHVRNLVTGAGCTAEEHCAQCPVQTLAIGSYDDLHPYFAVSSGSRDPEPDFRTALAYPRAQTIDPMVLQKSPV